MPYSDNLYSMVDDDQDSEPIGLQDPRFEEQPETDGHWDQTGTGEDPDFEAFSPTDGYFHSASTTAPVSSNVPHVPNIWVRDPSLEQGSTADSKAREAHRETLTNNPHLNSPTGSSRQHPLHHHRPAPSSSSLAEDGASAYYTYYQPSHHSSSSSSGAAHYQPSGAAYTPSTTTVSYTSSGPRQQLGRDHQSSHPRFPQDAPPAYTPSPTTSPTSTPAQNSWPRNYQTFLQPSSNNNNMGREESQGLLANENNNPESMGAPDDEYQGFIPAWRERVRRRHPFLNGRPCKMLLLGLGLLAITLGFVVSSVTSVRDEKANHPAFQDPPEANQPGSPDSRPILDPPQMDYPSFDGDDHTWPGDHYCKDLQFKQPSSSFDLSFGQGNSFTFIQDVQKDEDYRGHDIKVSGDLVIRRTGDGTPGPSAVVDIISNDHDIVPKIQFDADSQTLHVTVPRWYSWDEANSRPCMKIQATVWVPEDGALDNLVVENIHLGVKLLDNLSLQIARETHLTTTVGPVISAQSSIPDMPINQIAPSSFKFDSRWIEVKTTSADIKGYWPLYDYLGLHSTSGKIYSSIEPKPVNEDAPKPAVLHLKSLSGSVDFWEPTQNAVDAVATRQAKLSAAAAGKWIPPRDYRTNIQTTSGNIRGIVAFGSACRFHSTSGDMNVDLLPVLDVALSEVDDASSLETSCTSGKVEARVRDPIWINNSEGVYAAVAPDRPMRCLKSRHTTTSANVNLHFPRAWEGDLDLNTMTGSLKVWGKDLKKIKEGNEWPGVNKQLVARKGEEGGSYSMFKTVSGNIGVTVD